MNPLTQLLPSAPTDYDKCAWQNLNCDREAPRYNFMKTNLMILLTTLLCASALGNPATFTFSGTVSDIAYHNGEPYASDSALAMSETFTVSVTYDTGLFADLDPSTEAGRYSGPNSANPGGRMMWNPISIVLDFAAARFDSSRGAGAWNSVLVSNGDNDHFRASAEGPNSSWFIIDLIDPSGLGLDSDVMPEYLDPALWGGTLEYGQPWTTKVTGIITASQTGGRSSFGPSMQQVGDSGSVLALLALGLTALVASRRN